MKKLKHYLTASIGLILFVSVIALSLPQTGHSNVATDKDVRVINTPAEPVPVVAQGTTNVAVQNTPTVKAQQNGAWNVGLTGTPTVQLDDSATNPVLVRDVDRPTAQPFQYQAEVTFEDGFGGQNAAIPIPQGKLLVIEHVSVFGTAPADQRINTFSILTHVAPDNVYRFHYLQSTKEDMGNGTNQYMVSQQVRLYADTPNANVHVSRASITGTSTFRFVVSGYFVNK
ncbi:MAG: hypothetical protein LC768_07575 [Acidobacteria bacterium]|nr:hypothetical protein [Acidobacteriota bacterium]MCA1638180.1 hypothetical protein [Acidobacteriota bacterium]